MPVAETRRLSSTVLVAGVLTMLVGAWGALAPMVGPEFNFIANRSRSFTPTQSNVWLSVVPGAVAVVCGVLIAGQARTIVGRLRPDLWLLGLVAAFSGAWFCIGQYAWPALGGTRYIAPADSVTSLWKQFGFTVGVGMVLVLLGAVTMGWAGRRGPAATPAPAAGRIMPMPGAAAPVATAGAPLAYQPAPYQPAVFQPAPAGAPYQPVSSVPTAAVPVAATPAAMTQAEPAVADAPNVVSAPPAVVYESQMAADRPTVPSPPA